MTRIEIRSLKRASREEILRLYREAGWCEPGEEKDTRWIERLLAGSLCALGAFERGRGIGGRILREILKRVRARRCRWIGLIARPGSEGFYRRAGFQVMPGHRAMRLRTDSRRAGGRKA
jgi:GNAT superfamily N-acetyltransferase